MATRPATERRQARGTGPRNFQVLSSVAAPGTHLAPTLTASATDWFKKFLKRKQVLTGEIKSTESYTD